MTATYTALNQFNHRMRDGTRLFTACIEFMVWFDLAENVAGERGLPDVEKGYWAMVDAIRPRINFFAAGDDSRRKLKKDSFDLFAHTLRQTEPNRIVGRNMITMLHGAQHDKSDVFLQGYLWEQGYLRLGLSIEEVLADPGAFVQRCIQVVSSIKFMSGIGGFSMNYEDVYINKNDHLCAPIIGRFPGVNVINPARYKKLDGVPTVNWLTLVSDADLERLGGRDKVASVVTAPLTLHRLPHGVMIQAGPKPLLGDVNEQEPLDAYYAVGQLLAPVRSTRLVPSGVVNDDEQESTHWMHRFFRPQP